MAGQKVLILTDGVLSDIAQSVAQFFDSTVAYSLEELDKYATKNIFKVLVFDSITNEPIDKEGILSTVQIGERLSIPLIVLSRCSSIQDKLDALELGCDDFIEPDVGYDEVRARITKSIFNRIATEQLASRQELANQTAQSALVDNSELGLNIQFLLEVHECDNLDQLGQLFFTTIERYGLSCSLQLRSKYEVKNMEAHGMAKDLESQLLFQLKDSDRYIDFGKRTIINYGQVSLLIKNMPSEDPGRYGAIKDNTFSLLQGINARVVALEDHYDLLAEREALKNLSTEVVSVMATLKDSYQRVMRDIANEVELASDKIHDRIPHLSLTLSDEQFLEAAMGVCIKNTTNIFNEGLVLDHVMENLDNAIQSNLKKLEVSESVRENSESKQIQQNQTIELF